MNLSESFSLEDSFGDYGFIPGITTGIVKENWNEDNPGMVKVEIFLGKEGRNVTGFARVMTNYAGDGCGNYWFPETGQKVVVAFHMGERDCPVVLGTLWDEKNLLPENTANEGNTIKSLTTRSGCSMVFKDEEGKESIEFTTPAKLSVILNDEDKSICLRDKDGGNMIKMDCEGGSIIFAAKKKMEFRIGENTVISMDGNALKLKSSQISLNSDTKMSVEGQNIGIMAKTNVDISANAKTSIKASAGMQLNSDTILELNGAMLKFN